MLLGQQIEVFTDQKNLVHKHFNAERVMRWRLLLEEFGPKLHTLSRLKMAEEELSAEAFANELENEEEDFPTGHPLSCKEMAFFKRKTERCKTSSGHNPNCVLRSRALSQIARTSLLQRTIRFAFLSCCNISVPNGIT